jgi:hypothetical protein
VADYDWLPREKLWVNFLANNRDRVEQLGFQVDLLLHWPVTQSGCLTPCVVCDAPEHDGAFAEAEQRDSEEPAQAVGEQGDQGELGSADDGRARPCIWCWAEGAESRWERRKAEEVEVALRALFSEASIEDLD